MKDALALLIIGGFATLSLVAFFINGKTEQKPLFKMGEYAILSDSNSVVIDTLWYDKAKDSIYHLTHYNSQKDPKFGYDNWSIDTLKYFKP